MGTLWIYLVMVSQMDFLRLMVQNFISLIDVLELKKRKSGCVRRFKRETTSAVKDDTQDALAGGPLATFMQDGSHNHVMVADDSKDGYTITQLVNPVSYKASFSNDMLDVSVTFVAKRADGNLVLVDNKFLKMNNPLLLINFYEENMRYHPTE